MAESLSGRPYLTCAEAATYCGFKTIGGIQQAVRRGKLKPAGRRGGTGTYVFAREDLDAFLTGGLQPHERLFVPPELNEAAAKAKNAELPRRSARRAAAALTHAPAPGHAQDAGAGAAAGQSAPDDRSPGRAAESAAGAAPKTKGRLPGAQAPRPGKPKSGAKGKGKGPGAGKDAADPLARIMAALSGPTKNKKPTSAAKKR